MYVIADPDALSRNDAMFVIDAQSFGAIVDGLRVVGPVTGAFGVSGAASEKRRIGQQITAPRSARWNRVPPWLGGGFLFRAGSALYASEAFDGPLRPLVSISAGISQISFGPKGRARPRQRW